MSTLQALQLGASAVAFICAATVFFVVKANAIRLEQ